MDGLLCFGCFAIPVVILVLHGWNTYKMKRSYDGLAEELGGECLRSPDHIFQASGRIVFRHRGFDCSIRPTTPRRHCWSMEFEAIWPQGQFQAAVTSRDSLQRLIGMIYPSPFVTESPDFERYFRVSGAPLDARNLLSVSIRNRICQIRDLYGSVKVSWNPNRLRIEGESVRQDLESLREFTRQSLLLFDASLARHQAILQGEIQFLDRPTGVDRTTLSDGPMICKVCGDEISSDRVWCQVCLTPHHRDCWRYNHGCSTFGCKQSPAMLRRRVS